MASVVYDPRIAKVARGSLAVGDVNTGTIIIPNEKDRKIYIYDAWVRAIGSPGAGTATTYLREYRPNITSAAAAAADYVTINGLTFTAHASTTTYSTRAWNIAGATDTEDAIELVKLINHPTFGVRGCTASNAAGVVTLISEATLKLTTSNTTRLAINSGGLSFMTVAKAGLSNGVITRAGSTQAATCTYLSSPATTRYPVQIFCPTADITTTTYLDYVVKYTVS